MTSSVYILNRRETLPISEAKLVQSYNFELDQKCIDADAQRC